MRKKERPLIVAYIEPMTRQRLRWACFRTQMPLSAIVRAALGDWLEQWESQHVAENDAESKSFPANLDRAD